MDLDCKAGLNPQQSLDLPQLTQAARETIADGAATTSRASGVVAAAATAAAAQSGPYGRPAQALATGATAVGLAADAVEQAVRPDLKKFFTEQIVIGVPAGELIHRFPIFAPLINEIAEQVKAKALQK
jgi:hypothetical protein